MLFEHGHEQWHRCNQRSDRLPQDTEAIYRSTPGFPNRYGGRRPPPRPKTGSVLIGNLPRLGSAIRPVRFSRPTRPIRRRPVRGLMRWLISIAATVTMSTISIWLRVTPRPASPICAAPGWVTPTVRTARRSTVSPVSHRALISSVPYRAVVLHTPSLAATRSTRITVTRHRVGT